MEAFFQAHLVRSWLVTHTLDNGVAATMQQTLQTQRLVNSYGRRAAPVTGWFCCEKQKRYLLWTVMKQDISLFENSVATTTTTLRVLLLHKQT